MRSRPSKAALRAPMLVDHAKRLDAYLKTLPASTLATVMRISPALAEKTKDLIADWSVDPAQQSLAIDTFIGDIYSGLQVSQFSVADREYADKTLYILSGLYGVVRPKDGICPYRLEMGYKLPDPKFANLYTFWGESIADCLPKDGPIVNLAAVEYAQTVTPYVVPERIIIPKFLTIDPKTGQPTFVIVHAKIARGAFARWLIQHKIDDAAALRTFNDIGYRYDKALSTAKHPAFVCKEFGGKGLSMRLT